LRVGAQAVEARAGLSADDLRLLDDALTRLAADVT